METKKNEQGIEVAVHSDDRGAIPNRVLITEDIIEIDPQTRKTEIRSVRRAPDTLVFMWVRERITDKQYEAALRFRTLAEISGINRGRNTGYEFVIKGSEDPIINLIDARRRMRGVLAYLNKDEYRSCAYWVLGVGYSIRGWVRRETYKDVNMSLRYANRIFIETLDDLVRFYKI